MNTESTHDALFRLAQARSKTLHETRTKRLLDRKRELDAEREREAGLEEESASVKLRRVLCAIREETNTDIDMHVDMPSGELYTAVCKALKKRSDHQNTETKFLGEALTLVNQLNNHLKSR